MVPYISLTAFTAQTLVVVKGVEIGANTNVCKRRALYSLPDLKSLPDLNSFPDHDGLLDVCVSGTSGAIVGVCIMCQRKTIYADHR